MFLNSRIDRPGRYLRVSLHASKLARKTYTVASVAIADHLGEFHARHGRGAIGWAILLRLEVLPACFLGLGWFLPASVELKHVIVLQAAMTPAVFPIVMARIYGGDAATAVRVTLATSVVGLLTIPLWIRVG